ncbi:hypothetical protein BT93_K1213 [Corymbia citriodora subsp. variegata]|nr:hypothetical protein BT93_K1213 [Corymbia citriodora subsp. variegata]
MAEAQDQKGKKTTTIDREKMDLATAEAKRFMEDYYRTFDANRADLVNLYRDDSAMDFDYQKIQGKEAILAKLTSLQRFRFQIDKIDCLPDALEGSGALVMVTGFIWLDGRRFCWFLHYEEAFIYCSRFGRPIIGDWSQNLSSY